MSIHFSSQCHHLRSRDLADSATAMETAICNKARIKILLRADIWTQNCNSVITFGAKSEPCSSAAPLRIEVQLHRGQMTAQFKSYGYLILNN